jgi:Tfp pilus assembly protein PilX
MTCVFIVLMLTVIIGVLHLLMLRVILGTKRDTCENTRDRGGHKRYRSFHS